MPYWLKGVGWFGINEVRYAPQDKEGVNMLWGGLVGSG